MAVFSMRQCLQSERMRAALVFFACHLGLSALLAMLVAVLVMGLWYPYPYRDLAGGMNLFWIMVGVDVMSGPLLTLVLFNPAKSRRELTLDLGLVALVQLAALIYGLYSISLARPVMLVHETDRFVVVTAADLQEQNLSAALPVFQNLPWTGPVQAGVRKSRHIEEMIKSVELSLGGLPPSLRPDWWQPYADSVAEVKTRMRPVSILRNSLPPNGKHAVDAAVQKTQLPIEALHYLPLVAHNNLDGWVVLLNNQADIVGYAPVSGFGN